jgi:putative IMPACT (imprinted ancient) family translation regulator
MKNIINGVLYTVRYFGGIKLGKGGLVRAYTDSAKLAIENAVISEFILYQTIRITTIYPLYEILEHEMNNRKIIILDKTFSEQVKCMIRVRKDQIDSLIRYFSELGIKTYDIMD